MITYLIWFVTDSAFLVCANFTLDKEELAVHLNVTSNDQALYHNMISAKNPPPMCVPVPYIPVVNMCIRLFDIVFTARNIQFCIDLVGRVFTKEIAVWYLMYLNMSSRNPRRLYKIVEFFPLFA